MPSGMKKNITKPPLTAFPQEQLLMDHVPIKDGATIFCTSLGRAQLGAHVATHNPTSTVVCLFLDKYRYDLASEFITEPASTMTLICAADFPKTEADQILLPTSQSGEAELTRDLLQNAHQQLKIGGSMAVSTDNPTDKWLHEEMKKLFKKVTIQSLPTGVVYSAIKTENLKKIKDHSSTFYFRDKGELITAYSRPGVFSHRRLDLGARKLINHMDIQENDHVLDIGCGWGAVSLAAAKRAKNVTVHAIDSSARAIECTTKGASLNTLSNITATLTASGELPDHGTYTKVLANPPYYADFRIAELFAKTGAAALASGGTIYFVTKFPEWYMENLPAMFNNIIKIEDKDYFIINGEKP